MNQIKELLDVLKQTPEMAIWALGIYFLFILIKMASWIFATKIVLQQFIKRFFDYKEKSLNNQRGRDIASMFENDKISSVDYSLLIKLLDSVKKGSPYIHQSDIESAIKKIKSS